MTTLTVPTTHDYSADSLSGIDVIDFANGKFDPAAIATFVNTQFNNVAILDNVQIDGTLGVNGIVVNGGSVDASGWTFGIAPDTITLNGSSASSTTGRRGISSTTPTAQAVLPPPASRRSATKPLSTSTTSSSSKTEGRSGWRRYTRTSHPRNTPAPQRSALSPPAPSNSHMKIKSLSRKTQAALKDSIEPSA
jgi:hypothetical protein